MSGTRTSTPGRDARPATIVAALCVLVVLVAIARDVAGGAPRDETRFPHERHARLFPTCAGCHAEVAAGRAGYAYPPRELCAECHDGADRATVDWRGPAVEPTNLAFSHAAHARRAGALDCATCHAPRGDTAWMHVARARPSTCLGCHAHRATAHLADDAPCASCHQPLTAVRALPASRIAAFPRPPSHRAPDFLARHGARVEGDRGALAQCAVCHAQESCAQCHLNAASLPSVQALGRDARVAALAATREPAWPSPPSHADPRWDETHAAPARAGGTACATCHAQSSCTTCHVGDGAREVIARLPVPPPGTPQGVRLRLERRDGAARDGGPGVGLGDDASSAPGAPGAHARVATDDRAAPDGAPRTAPMRDDRARPVRVHPVDFARSHGAAAATARISCAGCHAQRFCETCHGGESARRFHPADFVARHAPEAYGQERDCASCHNTEVFCRGCHEQAGARSRGRRDVAYHDAQPDWLLQHGRAARQALTTCTSCHLQRDCMQCHSQRGLRVNPHGPGFDARRLAARSRVTCTYCHVTDPLAGH